MTATRDRAAGREPFLPAAQVPFLRKDPMATLFQPDPYILVLTGAGFLIALVAWLPLALRKLPLSLPIVCIALSAALFSLPQVTLKPLPLLYGLNHVDVAGADHLWGLVGLVVLFSVVLHGLTVTLIMRLLDRQHGRDPDKDEPPAVGA